MRVLPGIGAAAGAAPHAVGAARAGARPAAAPRRGAALRGAPARLARHPSRRGAPAAPAAAAAAGAAAPPAWLASVGSTVEALPEQSATRVTVTVPAAACAAAYRATLDRFRASANVDGYRKGKAPDGALVAHLGGAERVANSALADLLEPAMAAALGPLADAAIADSERIEQGGDELAARFGVPPGAADFTFSVVFDTVPEVVWRTPYKSLSVSVATAGDEAGDAAKAAAAERAALKEGASLRVAAGRGVRRGDVAVVDFSAARADTGEPLPGTQRAGMQLDTDSADETFLPGVVGCLLGLKAGEERAAPLTLPSGDDFQPAALRGVACTVTVKVNEVFEWDLPAPTDAWADERLAAAGATDAVGGGLAALRARLLAGAADERRARTREAVADAFTAAVAAAVDARVPDAMLQELASAEYSRELNGLVVKGALSWDQVQQLATPRMLANYIKNKRPELEELQRSQLGFADIFRREGLAVSPAEMEAEYAAAEANMRAMSQGEWSPDALREQVKQGLEAAAVMDWLLANCKVEVRPPAAAAAGGGGGGGGGAPAAAAAAAAEKPKAPRKPRAAAKPKAAAPAAPAAEGGEAPKRRGRPKKAAA